MKILVAAASLVGFCQLPAVSCFVLHMPTTIQTSRTQQQQQHYKESIAFSTSLEQQQQDDTLSDTVSTLRQVTFAIPRDADPDLICEFLMELGACSTSIVDAEQGTCSEQPWFAEPNYDVSVKKQLWNACRVSAQFPRSTQLSAILDLLEEFVPSLEPIQIVDIVDVEQKDWVVAVQQSWMPIRVGRRLVLRFPWHTQHDVDQVVLAATNKNETETASTKSDNTTAELIELELQGGIAFGTGEHATTQLCLEWTVDTVEALLQEQDQLSVLDYGSGSGVLGMAACAVNRRRVVADGIDIDLDCCLIANQNAKTNRVAMNNYLPPISELADAESKSLLLKAHKHARDRLEGMQKGENSNNLFYAETNKQYNVCVANILAGPLMSLASTLAEMTRPGGRLGLSGILSRQGNEVVAAYQQAGFEHVKVEKELDGWVLVTGQRA
jgi:ribosomal protein L11 methyltransferase